MTRENYDSLCAAKQTLCAFCEVDECEYCIVSRLIDDAYIEPPDSKKDETC